MKAYDGAEPFVFLSYAHLDEKLVEQLLVGLKRNFCRIWYDEGLTPGESWNDELAEKIKAAEEVIVLLTENSANSKYVKSEINYAISKNKKIIPVCKMNTELPAGLEMMLAPYQCIFFEDEGGLEKVKNTIVENLSPNVFSTKRVPFLEVDSLKFYLKKHSVVKRSTPFKVTEDGFSILCEQDGIMKTLFEFTGIGAYEIDYSVTQCKSITDDFYVGMISGSYVLNVLASCLLEYPLNGPDFDCLMMFILRVSDEGEPSILMIDYKYVNVNQLQLFEGRDIQHSPYSSALHKKIQDKLFVVYSDLDEEIE